MAMISKLSYMIADFLYAKGVIKNSEKEIYHYGYILILDGLLDTILLLVYGLLIHKFVSTVLFVLVFKTFELLLFSLIIVIICPLI